MTTQNTELTTKNVKFCAYLMLNEVYPVKVNKLGRGKGEFIYVMEQERWDNFQITFNASPYIKYAHCIESVRDLCY